MKILLVWGPISWISYIRSRRKASEIILGILDFKIPGVLTGNALINHCLTSSVTSNTSSSASDILDLSLSPTLENNNTRGLPEPRVPVKCGMCHDDDSGA